MRFFEEAYRGCPPWEIGRPQPAFVRLEEAGEIVGRVLDVGCGTGENAYYLADHGHPTWGIDLAPTAIERARAKQAIHPGAVEFRVTSALGLEGLGARFDTVIDSGLFHTFVDEERARYSASLRSALVPDGRAFILCFSEREPTDWGGPRRVHRSEIRGTFSDGWEVRGIREERFATRDPAIAGWAWLAALRTCPSRARALGRP